MTSVRTEFPCQVGEIENLWIPVSDGTRLAARVWLPDDAKTVPVPVILECIPYRKRDRQAIQDRTIHRYFAGYGYAAVRVDIRGTGDSDGVCEDEYTTQEHDDIVDVIAWLADQSWCVGSVGMMGISWGGFNSLQVAARQPPALKAIITVASTDDRYADDVHYMGGCLLPETIGWGATFFSYAPLPPDPQVVGERWREMWLDRMRGCPVAAADWIAHQWRDAYWRHGSVCEDYGAIEAAVYTVCGWADGYMNTVMRLLENLPGPRKGLIGPWGHAYPHVAGPGPAIGFLQEALRWWDHWLKGIDTGIMDEPMLRVWMQQSERPQAEYDERAGNWVAEPVWPPRDADRLNLFAHGGHLVTENIPREEAVPVSTSLRVGAAAADWGPYGIGPDLATDQRNDDAQSVVFDSEPLEAPLQLLGTSQFTFDFLSNKSHAQIVARLCDVWPDGTSARITYGVLNLTHRDGHETARLLEPGSRYGASIKLNDVAYQIPAGHRLRLALSTSYWPVIWPSPAAPTLTLFTGSATLRLPVRGSRPDDGKLPAFQAPEKAPPPPHELVHPPIRRRESDAASADGSELRIVKTRDRGDARLTDIDWTYGSRGSDTYIVEGEDPLSTRIEAERSVSLSRGDFQIRVESSMTLSATLEAFRLQAEFEAYESDTLVHARSWDLKIPREGV